MVAGLDEDEVWGDDLHRHAGLSEDIMTGRTIEAMYVCACVCGCGCAGGVY